MKKLHPFYLASTLLTFSLSLSPLYSQSSQNAHTRGHIHIGYERMFTKFYFTSVYGNYFRWTTPERYQLLQLRNTDAHGFHLAIDYNFTPWFSLSAGYKMHFMRFYVWPGTFIEPHEAKGYTPGLFYITPQIDWQFGPFIRYHTADGANIYSHSFLLTANLSHRMPGTQTGRLHYILAIGGSRIPIPKKTNPQIDYFIDKSVYDPIYQDSMRYHLRAQFHFVRDSSITFLQPFVNVAIAYSQKIFRKARLHLEFGVHKLNFNFTFSEALVLQYIDSYYWNIQLSYTEYPTDSASPYYQKESTFNYFLFFAGFYSNLSISFPIDF